MITATPTIDAPVVPEHLPFLESICWQTADVYQFTPEEMLSRYERGWEYRQLFGNPESEELGFLKELAERYHSWLQTDLSIYDLQVGSPSLCFTTRCRMLKS